MEESPFRALTRAVVAVAAVTLFAACAGESPVTPGRHIAARAAAEQMPDLGTCDSLQAPAGSVLVFHAYATGVQIYTWTGASWTFVAPSATLFADAANTAVVATHFAGPTWQSLSGSKVVGTTLKRCTPDAKSIPWLLLAASSTEAPGIFQDNKFVQRLNTVGGLAPATPGTVINDIAKVPYTAEYYFYR